MYEVSKETEFSGAHRLRDYGGPCEELHGHNWRVRACVRAEELDAPGMVIDFKLLKSVLNEVCGRLDHKYINDIPPFDSINPSAENLARYFFDEISKRLDDGRAKVRRVMVWESGSSCAMYEPDRV